MKVRSLPSVERLSAISDLELKLVTSWLLSVRMFVRELFGTSRLLRTNPKGVIWSRNTFAVTPKEGSGMTLLKTKGYFPLLVAGAHGPTVLAQFGGSIAPTFTLLALSS